MMALLISLMSLRTVGFIIIMFSLVYATGGLVVVLVHKVLTWFLR